MIKKNHNYLSLKLNDSEKITTSVLSHFLNKSILPLNHEYDSEFSCSSLLAEIQQDLICLLNNKRVPADEFAKFPELLSSILCYGLPDLSRYNPLSEQDRNIVRELLEKTINCFEKRLSNVRVYDDLLKYSHFGANMYFCISAEIIISTETLPVYFDSMIQPATDRVFLTCREIARLNT